METSDMKNMVVLKNLPSNMVEEAIIIFKEKQRIKEGVSDCIKKGNVIEKNSKSKEYILKEAELLVNDYINKIENKRKIEKKDKSIEKKYKRMKYYSLTVSVLFIISFIINFI